MDQLIIAKPEWKIEKKQVCPLYNWNVLDKNNEVLFFCEYINEERLIIRLRNVFGPIAFNKIILPQQIEKCIEFCLRYYEDYNNLGQIIA